MVEVVDKDTVALKGKGACVIFGVRFCIVAVVLFVAEIIGITFCGGVIIFGEGVIVSIFGGGVLIFGFGVVISSSGGLLLGGGVIMSGGGICIFDGSIFCGGVSIFEVPAAVQQVTPVVLKIFLLNGDFALLILAVFGVLFPEWDAVQHEVTFDKSLLTSLCN